MTIWFSVDGAVLRHHSLIETFVMTTYTNIVYYLFLDFQ